MSNKKKKKLTTKQITVIGLFSALSYVLMLIHLPFKYLGFLELEFSDIPAIIAALAYGPIPAVLIELIKNLIKSLTASTTFNIGELANFVVSTCYVIPLGFIFNKYKSKARIVIGFIISSICFIIAGILVNYFITVPLYAKMYGGMDAIINLTSKTVPAIHSLTDVVILGITPFNVIKSIIISIVGWGCYKVVVNIVKN